MIAPVVQPGVDSVKVYLPKDSQWYSIYDYSYGQVQPSGYETYPAPMDYLIPVFVRGGHILPRQRPGMTTTASRKNELQLLIALEMSSESVEAARKVASHKAAKWRRISKKVQDNTHLPPSEPKSGSQDEPSSRKSCDPNEHGTSTRNDSHLPSGLQGLQRPRSQTIPASFGFGSEDAFLFPKVDVSDELSSGLKEIVVEEEYSTPEDLNATLLDEKSKGSIKSLCQQVSKLEKMEEENLIETQNLSNMASTSGQQSDIEFDQDLTSRANIQQQQLLS
uniref:Glycosyl hydrolase family 31 C-terminal domain-containing protein n=1 Tax=Acrobeloides nanus TaxID=290746 RepID=A0A914DF42_9BILA